MTNDLNPIDGASSPPTDTQQSTSTPSWASCPTTPMSSTLEKELIEIYKREVEELAFTEDKYNRTIGASEIAAIVDVFRLAIENGVDKVNAQMLFDMLNNNSKT